MPKFEGCASTSEEVQDSDRARDWADEGWSSGPERLCPEKMTEGSGWARRQQVGPSATGSSCASGR